VVPPRTVAVERGMGGVGRGGRGWGEGRGGRRETMYIFFG